MVAVAYLRVMRRHDFDPAFIEGVLNVAMQLRSQSMLNKIGDTLLEHDLRRLSKI